MYKRLENMENIGLFPLGLVLFPESVYPLHIFEERYKQLINDSIDNNLEFGINLITESSMQEIGGTAKVADIIKKYPDGKIDILMKGYRRYKILNFKQDEQPYYTAEIQLFVDDEPDVSTLLLDNSIELFNQIAENVKSVKVDKLSRNQLATEMPSFFMAQKAGLTGPQKQLLLEMRSENQRLNFIIEHMRKILPLLKNKEAMGDILKYDGYYKPDIFKS